MRTLHWNIAGNDGEDGLADVMQWVSRHAPACEDRSAKMTWNRYSEESIG